MKNTTKKIVTVPLLAIAFLPVLGNAANVDLNMNVGIGGEKDRSERTGSSSRPYTGTTSKPLVGGKSIGGLISLVSSSSFTVEYPTKNGTTTVTVNTDSDTAFRRGTSTIALTNLSVGQRVSVRGDDYSTSTNTITAKQVTVLPDMKNADRKADKQGFISRFFGWLKKLF